MIFTSYFAKIKKFPENVIPIAICAKVPDWYNGIRYPKLAPKYDILMKYKDDHNAADYTECFNNTALGILDPVLVLADFQMLLDIMYGINLLNEKEPVLHNNPDIHVALVCYEKPSEFCHRHLVAEWLRSYGVECKEWEDQT